MTGDVYFQTSHFADLEQFEIGSHLADFGQLKIDPICFFLLTFGRSQLL